MQTQSFSKQILIGVNELLSDAPEYKLDAFWKPLLL